MTRILFIGQKTDTVDFSDSALPPGLDATTIDAGIAEAVRMIAARGWQADVCLIAPDDPGIAQIDERLHATSYDCVVIGAGLRIPPGGLVLFEKVINAVHRGAPQAAIAFNARPQDSAAAVARWLAPGAVGEIE